MLITFHKMRLFITLAIIFTSCRSLNCLDQKQKEVSRLNFFDTDLLHYSAENKPGNVMVSPASVKSTLSMLLEGARGATEAEIRSALRLSPEKEEYREQLTLYLNALQVNTTGVVLQNANAVFVSKNISLHKEYEIMMRNLYMSDVFKLDFNNSRNSCDTINNWVNRKTNGLIPFIIEPAHISSATEILISNTIYFKGAWKYGFDPKFTQGACFHVKGSCKPAAVMELQAELNYAYVDNLRAHAIELPYQGERYSMVLLVPQEHDGLVNLIRDLPYMSLPQISKLMHLTDVELSMPRFTIDYGEDLVAALKSMRITSLFSSSSNLTGIFEGASPQINSIFHRVHMSVDEEGTVAAAATSAMVVPLISNGVQIKVDKPFAFFIRDNKLGLVLFEGKIEEPNSFVEPSIADVKGKPSLPPVANNLNNGRVRQKFPRFG